MRFMKKETKYGVISDLHGDPKILPVAIEILKSQGAEKLLVNGDIGDSQKTLEDSQNYYAFVLDQIGKSGLESFVQPGSHETLLGYGPVIDYFADKYDNMMDTQRISHIDTNGHQLIFLPGSDFSCGGEYLIGDNEIPSGRYMHTEKGALQFDTLEEYVSAINGGVTKGAFQYANMDYIKKIATNPEKTIMVCHVPRKFNNLENAVDMAHFYQERAYHKDPKDWNNFTFTELNVLPGTIPIGSLKVDDSIRIYGEKDSDEKILQEMVDYMKKEEVSKWCSIVERKQNRGNEDLARLYDELGIRKAVSGHFHESGHRACDRQGNHVQERVYTPELFWNSGFLSGGQTGILTVRGKDVKYQNINLRDHLR